MLTNEQIDKNKETFINLLYEVNRDGSNIDKLLDFLEASDFFHSPASKSYHCAYEGGLCEHSLNVYYNLFDLCSMKAPNIKIESILICGLLHDISKSGLYVKSSRNKKVYSDYGSKSDSLGRFDWETEVCYDIAPIDKRFIYGNHEQNSEKLVSVYIPLYVEESSAILHHMGGLSWDSAKDNICEIYNKYTLATLLHIADLMTTYIDERN